MAATVKLTSEQLSHTYAILLPMGGAAQEIVKRLVGYVDKNGNSFQFLNYEDLRDKIETDYEGLEADVKNQHEIFPSIIKQLQLLYTPKTNLVLVLHSDAFLKFIKLHSKRIAIFVPEGSVVKNDIKHQIETFAVKLIETEAKRFLKSEFSKEDLIDGLLTVISDTITTHIEVMKYSSDVKRYSSIDELCSLIVKLLKLVLNDKPAPNPNPGKT